MGDRKYRPVYMFIFTGLILMVIMMNYSFNLIYYVQNRIYENAVKTLFPVETYFEDNYDENSGSVWVDSEYVFGMIKFRQRRRMKELSRQEQEHFHKIHSRVHREMSIIYQI